MRTCSTLDPTRSRTLDPPACFQPLTSRQNHFASKVQWALLFWKHQSDALGSTSEESGELFCLFRFQISQSSLSSNHFPTKWNWPKTRLKQILLTLQPAMLIIVTAVVCKRKSHYVLFVFLLIIFAHQPKTVHSASSRCLQIKIRNWQFIKPQLFRKHGLNVPWEQRELDRLLNNSTHRLLSSSKP